MATEEQPQVTVRGIPQNQYNENVAASTQDPANTNEGGIKGNLKKNWPVYTVVLAIITIIVMVWLNRSNSGGASTNTGYDTTGYGTGNSSPADLYGSQLDADYQQMINSSNITNSLLQQLLGAGSKTGTTGGTTGSGSSSGSSGGHKKPPKGGKGGKGQKGGGTGGGTKGGGNTGGSKGGYHGSTGGGHTKSGGTPSSHSVGTSHNNGKTTIKPNPHSGGAHGYVYTTKPGDTITSLQRKFWPGSSYSGGSSKGGANIFKYGNNSKLISQYRKSGAINSKGQIKPGTKLNA